MSVLDGVDLDNPRLTPEIIKAAIRSEFIFTANDGVRGKSEMGSAAAPHTGLDDVTICVLVLHNKTKVIGINYGAIDPKQHNVAQGVELARKDAENKVWELLGHELRTLVVQHRNR